MADMDIDCDGVQHGKGDDGRCESSGDTQSRTSFEDTVASYNKAFVHPYHWRIVHLNGDLLFGNSVNGNAGHDETDILYIAFTGKEAVLGRIAGSGTAPSSSNSTPPVTTLKRSTKSEGSTGIKSSSAGTSTSTGTCSWPGHCAGAATCMLE
ncbi:Endo-chitosanase C [Lachnellula arida]|uniref:Endo-chitosanase n=1 Tax=Lachnellula arida TaxID=1316785 RepID=A0A8T9BLA9_9HELO|nr:Endo-chitosanase C [Lachnellula arida]